MSTGNLKALLEKLHAEVDGLNESAQDEKTRLERLITEIETTLEQEDAEQQASLLDSLQGRLTELESDHPTASGIARRLMQALSDMGI